MKKDPKVALVLSGGAALGFAHVGVIDELVKNNIKIDLIVGTSMGAVVGGGYASGMSVNELIDASKSMRLTRLFDLNFRHGGLFSGQRIMNYFSAIFKVKKMQETKIEFACVSTNVLTNKEYVARTGDLVSAVRASMNLPGIFVPFEYNNKLLIDGGILNNFPDDVARNLGADIIIGVDVLKHYKYCNSPAKSSLDAIMNAFCLCNKRIQELKPKYADIVLEPKQDNVFQLSFKKDLIEKSIESGRVAARAKMSQIKELISNFE